MNSHFDVTGDDFGEIESIILAAKDFVLPSESLRPDTLDSIQEELKRERIKRTAFGLSGIVLLVAAAVAPLMSRLPELPFPVAPTSAEVQQQAVAYSSDPTVGTQWAMVETFQQMRLVQLDPNRRMIDL